MIGKLEECKPEGCRLEEWRLEEWRLVGNAPIRAWPQALAALTLPIRPSLAPPDPSLRIAPGLNLIRSELRWRFSRASGPGGQNVNKTDARVELLFPLATTTALPPLLKGRALQRLASRLVEGQLVLVAEEHRSQWRNRQAALERLLALLRQAIVPPPPPRRATRPSRGSVERRLAAKRQRSTRKAQRGGGIRPEED